MSQCPNCKKRLRIIDWRPQCPHCGVNVVMFGFEDRFYQDAKRAELSMGAWRVRKKTYGAGFKGALLVKLRLILMIVPLVSLLMPSAVLTVNLPFGAQTFQAGLLGVIPMLSGNSALISLFTSAAKAPVFGTVFQNFGLLFICMAAMAVFAVFALFFAFISFFSIKHLSRVAGVFASLGAFAALASLVIAILCVGAGNNAADGFVQAKFTYGALLSLICFSGFAVLNFVIARKGVTIQAQEGDLERSKLWKQYKKGELDLDTLPYPVVETAETRAHEAHIAALIAENESHDAAAKSQSEEGEPS
ncbi:MAG: hypothetical protein LBB67_06160 [Oscillospiraceae bacterium]|jgi:hypothetical protein|nr:hypothetical protein [Oscillospiraceae bacterium]